MRENHARLGQRDWGWEDLEPVEIMVRMVESGFEMEVSPDDAVRSLKRELEKFANS